MDYPNFRFYPSPWPWKYVLILYACINLHFVPLCVLFLKDSYIYSSNNEVEANGIKKKESKNFKSLGSEMKDILPIDVDEVEYNKLYDNIKNSKEKNDTGVVVEEITTEEKMLLEEHHDKLHSDTNKQDILLTSSRRESQCDNDKSSNSVQLYIKKLSITLKDPKTLCYFVCEAHLYISIYL